jgi:hypothetical protein
MNLCCKTLVFTFTGNMAMTKQYENKSVQVGMAAKDLEAFSVAYMLPLELG